MGADTETEDKKMLLICTASHEHNRELAEQIGRCAQRARVHYEIVDLTEFDLPLYTSKSESHEADTTALQEVFSRATAIFVLAPEYNGSIPPVLTNAIAWLSTIGKDFRTLFNGKVVALGTHSGGPGHKVLMAMRIMLAHLGCHIIGREISSHGGKPAADSSIEAILAEITQLKPQLTH